MRFGKKKPDQTETVRSAKPTGSAKVFSYHSSNSRREQTQARYQSSPKPFNWRKLPSVLAGLVILGSAFYLLSLDINPRVVVLSSQEQAPLLQKTEVYEQASQDILDNSVLSRNKLTINTKSIEKQLLAKFPELKHVAITVPVASHRLVFEIQPVEPALILNSVVGSHVLDKDGIAVVRTKDVPALGKLTLTQVIDESGLEPQSGKAVLTDQEVQFILELQRQFAAKKIDTDSLTLPAIPNELHVRPAGVSYYIKFNFQTDVRGQAGRYFAVAEKLAKENSTPREYIDVRVDERAYYK